MKLYKLLHSSLAVAVFGATFSSTLASEVELYLRDDLNGNGVTSFNMTMKKDIQNMEVEYPIYKEWGTGSTTGDVWGGGKLGALEFKNVAVLDFEGNDGTHACLNGNKMGMGIKSKGAGRQELIDGKESFTIKANRSFEFRGFKLRKGNQLGDNLQVAISSPAWGRLIDLVGSYDLGLGVTFSIKNGVGTFVLTNDQVVHDKQAILGDFTEDVKLVIGPGGPLTFDNHLDGKAGFALTSMMVKPDSAVGAGRSAVMAIGGITLQLNQR